MKIKSPHRFFSAVSVFAGFSLLVFSAFGAGNRSKPENSAGAKKAPTRVQPAAPTAPPATPRFFTYMSPQGVADSAGEPSIGSNWTKETVFTNHNINGTANSIPNGGSTLYYGGFLASLLKVTFSDCSSPATVTWDQKAVLSASTPRAAGDPILFTDHVTGRTFVAQLEGLTPAGATIDITDDDGDTFIPSDGVVPSDVDHETLGGGPYHAPLPNGVNPIYPNAVYYASQSVAEARCLRSDTGGLVFSQGSSPMFTAATCDGLHGHVKVSPASAPDAGTAYVPDKGCGTVPLLNGGNAAVAFSEDNGITWTVSEIPDGASEGEWDPSVGIATDGTIYLGYQDVNGHAKIAVGHHIDGGGIPGAGSISWSPSIDVGTQLGINNITFPAVVAGDPDRASFAFFGTTTADCLTCNPVQDHTGGSNDDPSLFTGVWYLYIATTLDHGATWTTQNVTPDDPVQRGPICGGSTCRNLLDFFDATIDKEGRVLVGYDDGCVSGNCISGGANDYTAKAAIARQTGGARMFHIYDPVEPAVPGGPLVTGSLNPSATIATLSWPVPDNGGSPIVGYNVYRKRGAGFSLLATVSVPGYTDSAFAAGDVYHVTAVNGVSEGPYCPDISPAVVTPPNPCSLPGVLAINDNDGDAPPNVPVDGSVNIQQLFVAEPFFGPGPANDKLVFTLQAAPSTLSSPPPNSQWIIIWNRQGTDGTDPNDASYDRLYVMMRTDANGTPSYEYGKFGIPLNEVPPPPPDPNANTPKMIGPADSGSYDVTTGLIRITVANDKLRAIDGGSGKYLAGSNLSALNVRTYFNRPDPGQRSQNNASDITANGSYALSGNAGCATPLQVISVVSAKTHGSAGEFDIPLPYTGSAATAGIECRSGGDNNSHTIVFTFVNPLVSVAGATASGTATIDTAHSGINAQNPHEYIVTLTGVANAQYVTVTLTGLQDTLGSSTPSLAATLGVLVGDVTSEGLVDGNDVSMVQSKTRQPIDSTNFRTDVNVSGLIDGNDVSFVQSHTRTSLH